MSKHVADRLADAINKVGAPVCVGLDPVLDRLPEACTQGTASPIEAIERFCLGVLGAVDGYAAAIKPQIACFERYGADGYGLYEKVVVAAKAQGFLVVGDAKRGDIGLSSSHYASRLLAGETGCDFLTVNGYMGGDSLAPFAEVAAAEGKGLFVLVCTSNPGAVEIQNSRLEDGRSVSELVGDVYAALGSTCIGKGGYSNIGFVVGATKPEQGAALRARYPQQWFLLPGYGAQGGGIDGVHACQNDAGDGALVTASRSVIYAHQTGDSECWRTAVRSAAREMCAELTPLDA